MLCSEWTSISWRKPSSIGLYFKLIRVPTVLHLWFNNKHFKTFIQWGHCYLPWIISGPDMCLKSAHLAFIIKPTTKSETDPKSHFFSRIWLAYNVKADMTEQSQSLLCMFLNSCLISLHKHDLIETPEISCILYDCFVLYFSVPLHVKWP